MQETIQGNARVIEGIAALCPESGVRHSGDAYGNAFHWFHLETPKNMTEAAAILKEAGARLCVISAYNPVAGDKATHKELCYHFELKGIVYNVTLTTTDECPQVQSITPIFANADWHEREMMELLGVPIVGHPHPTRLFLDEELDAGLLNEVVPLSVMMNGACTTDLWERILKDKEPNA